MRAWMTVVIVAALGHAAPAAPLKVGSALGELAAMSDAAGKATSIKALRGSWVVFVTSADWCPAKLCLANLVAWNKLAAAWPKVVFAVIDLTPSDQLARAKKKYAANKLDNLKIFFVDGDRNGGAPLLEQAIPSTVLVDPKGIVRNVVQGYEYKTPTVASDALTAALTKFVKAAK
jgi:hypothetical protein